jgi:hypothetical protein
MMFNTGDLARWLPNGSLEHLGRKDDQVKMFGFRVELDGISAAIEKFPTITKACALKIDEKLWGFYSAPARVDEVALASFVGQGLAYYARPSIWHYLPVLQLTPNGKVDKKLLKTVAAEQTPSNLPASVGVKAAEDYAVAVTLAVPAAISRNSSAKSGLSISAPTAASISSFADSDTDTAMVISQGVISQDLKDEKERKASQSQSTIAIEATLDISNDFQMPPKKGFYGQRWLRHTALSAYRKLFALIFFTNLAVLAVLLWKARNVGFVLSPQDLAVAVGANLLASVLFRQDHIINFVFWLATRIPSTWPLAIRRHFARVYHVGGLHSGCGVSATMWWIIFTWTATADYLQRGHDNSKPHVDLATVVLTYLILSLLLAILVMAHPSIRIRMHDQFEWTHRFAGWTALALVWAHVFVSTAALNPPDQPLSIALAKNPVLYLVAAITSSIVLPWLRLRRVPVRADVLSRHAMRLYFDFETPPAGRGIRVTHQPLVEWHAFATITEPGVPGFSVVISRAGDFTGALIDKPPTRIWTRGELASGVLTVAPLFRKIVLVATGSGIGPCLPVIMERAVPCRVLWVVPAPEQRYGRGIMDNILMTDPDAVIWDTKAMGRPNLATLAYQLYVQSGAECVCIISNKEGTSKCVYELESRGVPAFGPVWDS